MRYYRRDIDYHELAIQFIKGCLWVAFGCVAFVAASSLVFGLLALVLGHP